MPRKAANPQPPTTNRYSLRKRPGVSDIQSPNQSSSETQAARGDEVPLFKSPIIAIPLRPTPEPVGAYPSKPRRDPVAQTSSLHASKQGSRPSKTSQNAIDEHLPTDPNQEPTLFENFKDNCSNQYNQWMPRIRDRFRAWSDTISARINPAMLFVISVTITFVFVALLVVALVRAWGLVNYWKAQDERTRAMLGDRARC
ncbi:MAG: hypothetical protein LQ344_001276 [Seirophora lacunosa]|nr:MAG: hypothetical protein LQ344_001276 [Seirophora lacunosa]